MATFTQHLQTMQYIPQHTKASIIDYMLLAKHTHCGYSLSILKKLKQGLMDEEHYEALHELQQIENKHLYVIPVVIKS